MIFPTFRFPQISRFFSATLFFIALWAGFGLLLAINSLSLLSMATSRLAYLPILRQPLSFDRHMEAAYTLRDQGNAIQAEQEVALAQDISGNEAVLGVWKTAPAELEDQFTHWKTITQQKPDYRDAFVMAATAAYQLGHKEEARTLIHRALVLDPSSPTVQELKTIIEEN